MILKHIADKSDNGRKVKQVLKSRLMMSERLIKKLKYDNNILVNGIPRFVNYVVSEGDVLEAHIDLVEDALDIIPEDIPIDIIYEDDSIIAINKQAGIVVHPTFSHPSGTIANAIMFYLLNKGVSKKIRPVSRLDRNTSGVIIFAKNPYVQQALVRLMSEKKYIKEYIGVVHGTVESSKGTIDMPIDRKPDSIMLRHVCESGYRSITHYSVIEYLNAATLLKFDLETGRTHQIRVHCQASGFPLFGDELYSDIPTQMIKRQALHSHRVSFPHPITNQNIDLIAKVPDDITHLINELRKDL